LLVFWTLVPVNILRVFPPELVRTTFCRRRLYVFRACCERGLVKGSWQHKFGMGNLRLLKCLRRRLAEQSRFVLVKILNQTPNCVLPAADARA
jgi:hypothetical protein